MNTNSMHSKSNEVDQALAGPGAAPELSAESRSESNHLSRAEPQSSNTARRAAAEGLARSPQPADPMPTELHTTSYWGQIELAVTLGFMAWALVRLTGQLLQ